MWGEPYVANSKWSMHQRIKQYRGPHTESWGGRAIEIDSDRVDSLQASAKFVHEVISSGDLVTRKGPGASYPAVGRRESGSSVNVICQAAGSPVGATNVWDRLADGTYVSDLYVGTPNKRGYSAPIPKCRYSYMVWTDALRVRSGPGTNYPQVGQILYGGMANVLCQRTGTKVGRAGCGTSLTTAATSRTGTPPRPAVPGTPRRSALPVRGRRTLPGWQGGRKRQGPPGEDTGRPLFRWGFAGVFAGDPLGLVGIRVSRQVAGQHVVGVDDAVGVPLLGKETLTVRGEVLVVLRRGTTTA